MSNSKATPVEGVSCVICDAKAEYNDTRNDQYLCERCARRDSTLDYGMALGGWNSLRMALAMLSDAGLGLTEIHEAIDRAWENPVHRDEHAILADIMPSGLPEWACGQFEDDSRFTPLNGRQH